MHEAGTRVPGNDPWRNVVYLNRNDSRPNLNANWDDNRNSNYAVPVCRDCSTRGRSYGRPLLVLLPHRLDPAAEHTASSVEL